MPMIHECLEPGCPVLTMGEYCVDHEVSRALEEAALLAAVVAPDFAALEDDLAPSLAGSSTALASSL